MDTSQSPVARWLALATLVGPVLLLSIDMSVISIAVPAISAGLGPTSAQMLWIIDIYSFLLAGLLVLAGSLGDRFGRKRMLMIGAPAFGLASLATAFAPNPELLILARAALGASAATLMPSTLGLIRTIFDDAHERRLAIAVWAAAFGGGGALGPVLGGLLLEWHYSCPPRGTCCQNHATRTHKNSTTLRLRCPSPVYSRSSTR